MNMKTKKPKKIDLTPYVKKWENELKEAAAQAKKRAALPKGDYTRLAPGILAIEELVKQQNGKSIETAVAKYFLYDMGYTDHEARMLLWIGTGENRFNFDRNLNISEN
jgi:hypothetical protein